MDDETEVDVGDDEARLAAQLKATCGYQLAHWATNNLAVALHRSADATTQPHHVERVHRHALRLGSARVFRLARAGMTVLAAGYEGEARIMDRALLETRARVAQALLDDTGETAQRWLEGRLKGELTAAIRNSLPGTPHEDVTRLYRFLSGDTHPDARQQLAVLLHRDDSGAFSARFGPHRGQTAERSLFLCAWLSAEATALLGTRFGVPIEHHDQLEEALLAWAADLHATKP